MFGRCCPFLRFPAATGCVSYCPASSFLLQLSLTPNIKRIRLARKMGLVTRRMSRRLFGTGVRSVACKSIMRLGLFKDVLGMFESSHIWPRADHTMHFKKGQEREAPVCTEGLSPSRGASRTHAAPPC